MRRAVSASLTLISRRSVPATSTTTLKKTRPSGISLTTSSSSSRTFVSTKNQRKAGESETEAPATATKTAMASSSETAKESAEITPTRTESPSAPVPPEKLLFASAAGKPNQQAAQFTLSSLTPATLSASPLTQFHTWYSESSTHPPTVKTPETCTLATASLPSGRVSARIVYLKQLDTRGFVIYTNTAHSRKSADLRTNGLASLVFWWAEQERQVRVEGAVEFLPAPESQQYYDTRIRASRIGAWASPQSAVIADRAELEQKVREREAEFAGNEKIPVPPHWGGVRLVPDMVEFWQGREGRLHDRFRYTKKGDGGVGADDDGEGWKVERLAP